jgi:hypothetical protein
MHQHTWRRKKQSQPDVVRFDEGRRGMGDDRAEFTDLYQILGY